METFTKHKLEECMLDIHYLMELNDISDETKTKAKQIYDSIYNIGNFNGLDDSKKNDLFVTCGILVGLVRTTKPQNQITMKISWF